MLAVLAIPQAVFGWGGVKELGSTAVDGEACEPPLYDVSERIPVQGGHRVPNASISAADCGLAYLHRKYGLVIRAHGAGLRRSAAGQSTTVRLEACKRRVLVRPEDIWFAARLIGDTTISLARVVPAPGTSNSVAWNVTYTPPTAGDYALEIRVVHDHPLVPQPQAFEQGDSETDLQVLPSTLLAGQALPLQQLNLRFNIPCKDRCYEDEECFGWSSNDPYSDDTGTVGENDWTSPLSGCRLFTEVTGVSSEEGWTSGFGKPRDEPRSKFIGGQFMAGPAGHWNNCSLAARVFGRCARIVTHQCAL